jgi:hypothetical protein
MKMHIPENHGQNQHTAPVQIHKQKCRIPVIFETPVQHTMQVCANHTAHKIPPRLPVPAKSRSALQWCGRPSFVMDGGRGKA